MSFASASKRLVGIFVLALAFLASPVEAMTPLSVCIARAVANDDPAALLGHPERFDCATPQDKFGDGDYWVLSSTLPAEATRTGDLYARVASVWQDAAALHVLYADGHIASREFNSATVPRYLKLGAVWALPLPDYHARPVRLLWHIEGSANTRGIVLGPVIANGAELAQSEKLQAIFYGAFGGMAIALIVYNLALWGALRQSFQPVYCALVLCLLAYAVSSSGALGQMFVGMDNNDRLRLNSVALGASAIAALIFARTFFEPRVFAGRLGLATNIVIGCVAATSLLYAVLAPWQLLFLDHLTLASYMLLLGLVAAILVRARRNRSNYLWLFAIAWGAPIAFAGLRIGSALHLIAWNFWIDHSTTLSMMLEALLSSLAIAYRIRLLSRERDEARVQEIAARLLADTDPLTGLLNRRAFLAGAIGRPGDQTLLIADIDYFKRVNDAIGHDGGDEVLRVFARALRAALPADALVARIGGEEFAIVTDSTAAPVPDAILAALRRRRMPHGIAVTASIGTCSGPLLRDADWERLYRDADRALFAAKSAGRDRSRDATSLAA